MIKNNKAKLSYSSRIICMSKKGYRFTEPEFTDLDDVVKFEMEKLENKDISDTINKLYDKDLKSSDEVIKFIHNEMNAEKLCCIWLCDSERALTLVYNVDPKSEIFMYKLPNEYMIISDLDIDGTLIVTKEELKPEI